MTRLVVYCEQHGGLFDLAVELRNLKICFLAGTLGQGGAERQLYYIVRTLREHGVKLRLLCLTNGEFWEERIRALGIPVRWVGQPKSRALRLARIIAELRRFLPDVVQSQHSYTNLYAAATRILGVREIGAIRTDSINEFKEIGIIGRLSLRVPRAIAANSRAAIRNAIKQGVPAGRLLFLPNVVDTDQFKPATWKEEEPIRLIAVGRFVRQKRLDRFLSILARVQRLSRKEVRGVIVGTGSLKPRLEQQAAELGLLDVVEFRGAVVDMAFVYRGGGVFVLTSDWEGTPNVVLEAMASGLPVVATRVGDVPEIVQDKETGYLVDPGDDELMVEALRGLVDSSNLRVEMGCCARKYIVAHHSLHRLPAFLEHLYEVALS